jgi:hypothetical protein
MPELAPKVKCTPVQSLFEANAQRVIDVPTVAVDASISGRLVQADRFRLPEAGLDAQSPVSEPRGNGLQLLQDSPGDALPPRTRLNEHALHFSDAPLKWAQRAAAYGPPAEPGNDEGATRHLYVRRAERAGAIVTVARSQFGG